MCTVFHTPHYFIEIIKGDKVVQEISLQAAVATLGSILDCLAQTCGNIPAFIIGLYPQPIGGSPLLSVLFTLPRSSCHQGSRGSDCSSSCWSWWCWWRGSCGCCGSGTNRSWWRAGQLLELCGSLCILLLLLGEHGHVPRGQNKYSKIIVSDKIKFLPEEYFCLFLLFLNIFAVFIIVINTIHSAMCIIIKTQIDICVSNTLDINLLFVLKTVSCSVLKKLANWNLLPLNQYSPMKIVFM